MDKIIVVDENERGHTFKPRKIMNGKRRDLLELITKLYKLQCLQLALHPALISMDLREVIPADKNANSLFTRLIDRISTNLLREPFNVPEEEITLLELNKLQRYVQNLRLRAQRSLPLVEIMVHFDNVLKRQINYHRVKGCGQAHEMTFIEIVCGMMDHFKSGEEEHGSGRLREIVAWDPHFLLQNLRGVWTHSRFSPELHSQLRSSANSYHLSLLAEGADGTYVNYLSGILNEG